MFVSEKTPKSHNDKSRRLRILCELNEQVKAYGRKFAQSYWLKQIDFLHCKLLTMTLPFEEIE